MSKDSKQRMESISGMDAAFLYGETASSPMHIGGLAVIEGSISFDTFRSIIASRIHMMPKLRKRLMYVPLSIDYPYWVDDPYFDLDLHLHHIALPKPGGWQQLRDISSKIFSEPLDQTRPLWSFTFVEGLDEISQVPKGSIAIISKIHHVAIDGMAGAGMLSLIFDFTDEVKPIPEPRPWRPQPLPNELTLMWNSTMSFAKNPLKVPKLLSETISATVKSGFLTRAQKTAPPTAPFSAPSTPFNGIIAARRKWNTVILELDRVKQLKKIMGTTLNDVILAICAGALRRYLGEKDKLPNKPLVANVPISTRTGEGGDEHGSNHISSMLVQLATNVADPIERLEVIQENTIRGKTYNGALGAKTLSKMAEAVPFGVANQATKLYSRFHVATMHNPVFNVTITNVPGPQFPLYINGHKLISISGTAPLFDGMGLIITVFSYNGLLTISPTSDVSSMPDLDTFSRYLREAANELEAAILAHGKQPAKPKPKPTKAKSPLDPLFQDIKQFLKDTPSAFERTGPGIFQFQVTGGVEDLFWKIDLNKAPGTVTKRKAAKPDVTFKIAEKHLTRIAAGKLNVQTAFVQGRLKVDGDYDKAMKMAGMLGKFMKVKKGK